MKNGGGQFAPKSGGHFELESGGHFKLELGGQYHWNLQSCEVVRTSASLVNLPVMFMIFDFYVIEFLFDFFALKFLVFLRHFFA